jgi:transcriptional regulator with XRE-family HTH domain
MTKSLATDSTVLDEIGRKLARQRIESGLTQSALARQAGVGRSTVERLEAGHSTQMSSFIRILRVLGLLQQFVEMVPEPGPSPMALLKGGRKNRQRASGKRKRSVEKFARAWTWTDDL